MRTILFALCFMVVHIVAAQQMNNDNNVFTNIKNTKSYDSDDEDDLLTGKVSFSGGMGAPRIGLNVLSYYFGDNSGFSQTSSGPYFFKIGYGLSKNIEVGVNANLSSAQATYKTGTNNEYAATINYSSWSVLARMNYHFLATETLDPYVGISVGYRHFNFTYSDNSNVIPTLPKLPLGFVSGEIGVGLRYYVVPNVGLYAEVGISRALLQGGLIVRF